MAGRRLSITRESSTHRPDAALVHHPDPGAHRLPSLENVDLDALYREWSAFGQITYHFNPAFDLSLGGRWSENKQSENESIGGLGLVGPTHDDRREPRPAPTSSTRSRRAGM